MRAPKGTSSKRPKKDAPQHQRTVYETSGSHLRPIYTHGVAQVSHSGSVIFPCAHGARVLYRVDEKRIVQEWKLGEEDAAAAVALAPNANVGVIAARSGFVDIVEFSRKAAPQLRKRIRPFERTLTAMACFDTSGGLVALASRDGHIRVYDVDTADCTHVFRAAGATLTAVVFQPVSQRLQLLAGAEDGTLMVFDLATRARKPQFSVRHHVNAVTGIGFVEGGRNVVSISMDKTICLADALDLKLVKLVDADTRLAAVCAPSESMDKRAVVVSEMGELTMWDMHTGTKLDNMSLQLPVARKSSDEDEDEADEIAVVYSDTCDELDDGSYSILTTLSDQTIMVSRIFPDQPPKLVDLVCGNLEEIYSVGPITATDEKHSQKDLVLATNSPYVWVMRSPKATDGEQTQSWNCVAGLQGHSGLVLSIDTLESGKPRTGISTFVASASRDTTSRVWHRASASNKWKCIAVARGHTDAVGGVALSPQTSKGLFFLVTAAADRTLKLWNLDKALEKSSPSTGGNEFHLSEDCAIELRAKWTVLAHEKDINAVAVAPDGLTIATGSQDKTLKLWDSTKGKLRAVCRGHRRGLWDVSFSSVDKVVATSSSDATIRIWSVQSGACLRTLEGHLAGVLKTVFITNGTQIASSAADGLLKIWQTRSGECCSTVDAHEDRIWALAPVDDGDKLISGAGDGILSLWEDRTLQKADEAAAERERVALVAQKVGNDVDAKRWTEAAKGALELGMPQKLKTVIEKLITSAKDADKELTAMVKGLQVKEEEIDKMQDVDEDENDSKKGNELLTKLLMYCRDWNASGGPKSAALAARTLQAVFRVWTPAELSSLLTTEQRALVEALVAHGNRHYERVSALGTKVLFMEHVLESMRALPQVAFTKQTKVKRKKIEEKAVNGSTTKRRKKGRSAATEY